MAVLSTVKAFAKTQAAIDDTLHRAPGGRRKVLAFYDPAGDFTAGHTDPAITGEQRLVRQLLEDALRDAALPSSEMRDGARDWLRDDNRSCAWGFMARECFEALSMDYDAAMKKLEAMWVEWDSGRVARPKRTRHNARRRQV